ncbi:hypothetical protein KM92DES2_11114 [uncultured Desulfovibrio sp.]|uniref:Uncharacterized protein n=1 Tax=uncultured Desulfovibrio sp. TaxID=167968 RepID=A0A212JHE8_9BACT|nr:hypothetical protein KM92DES2_11114 [uncultured Desulfovibrio sp.]
MGAHLARCCRRGVCFLLAAAFYLELTGLGTHCAGLAACLASEIIQKPCPRDLPGQGFSFQGDAVPRAFICLSDTASEHQVLVRTRMVRGMSQ